MEIELREWSESLSSVLSRNARIDTLRESLAKLDEVCVDVRLLSGPTPFEV